eukprot:scaffold1170_cov125-Skeletonema_marinoi.AAC.18
MLLTPLALELAAHRPAAHLSPLHSSTSCATGERSTQLPPIHYDEDQKNAIHRWNDAITGGCSASGTDVHIICIQSSIITSSIIIKEHPSTTSSSILSPFIIHPTTPILTIKKTQYKVT